MGKGAIPEFSLLGNERLDYQNAKDRIYTKLYYQGVKDSHLVKQFLKNVVIEAINKGHNLAFKDYDVNLKVWEKFDLKDIIFSEKKCGHGYLVANMAKNYVRNYLKKNR